MCGGWYVYLRRIHAEKIPRARGEQLVCFRQIRDDHVREVVGMVRLLVQSRDDDVGGDPRRRPGIE